MSYHINRTEQLAEAVKKGHKSLATQLRLAGTPTRQHKGGGKKAVAKKSASKKTAAKKTSPKKSVAKKTTAKKAPAKTAAKKA